MTNVAVCVLAHGLMLEDAQLAAWRSVAPAQSLLVIQPHPDQTGSSLSLWAEHAMSLESAAWPGTSEWLLCIYPWEQITFASTQIEALLDELPAGLNHIGVMVKAADGQSWRWSARLLRRGAVWNMTDPGEALCDDLILQQISLQNRAGNPETSPVLTFCRSLHAALPEAELLSLLAAPWHLDPAWLEQIGVQAVDLALRAWRQETAQTLLAGFLARFPASPALLLMQSSLLSATGQLPACRQLLLQLQAAESEHIWSQPVCLEQPDYLEHLLALLAFWAGEDAVAATLIQASLPRPQPAELLGLLQQSESLMASRQFQAARTLLDQGIQAAWALPGALQTWARTFVPDSAEFPELGALACHHLDFISLRRLNPDRLLSRLLYARALAEFGLQQPQLALQTLAQALANPMGSPGKVGTVLQYFDDFLASGQAGDVVELGCNQGATSLGLQTCLQFRATGTAPVLHVYDSFEGLPPPLPEDGLTPYAAGSCRTAREAFVMRFQAFDATLPMIHAGWFAQTLPQELPLQIGFAYLDGDFYSSIYESLEAVYPRLLPGATVLIDDYGTSLLPGVEKACADFFRDKPEQLTQVFCHGVEALGWFQKI